MENELFDKLMDEAPMCVLGDDGMYLRGAVNALPLLDAARAAAGAAAVEVGADAASVWVRIRDARGMSTVRRFERAALDGRMVPLNVALGKLLRSEDETCNP